MSTISISELEKKSPREWLQGAANDDLIILSNGKPVAVLMQLGSSSVEAAQSFVRSIRALTAQSDLQERSAQNGTAKFVMDDIDTEITAARRDRQRK